MVERDGWGATFVNFEATLTAPGDHVHRLVARMDRPAGRARTTPIQVTAVDGTGKVDATKPWVPFRVA